MRTAEEFRERKLQMLPRALQRPGFFCGNAGDLFFAEIFRDLLWLEERDSDFQHFVGSLLGGSMGVFGQFYYQCRNGPNLYENEIASTFAEAAFRLSYFTPSRLLTITEFDSLHAQLDLEFLSVDHTLSELLVRFGPPSHDVLGGDTTVHCYGCIDRVLPWVYFDYSRCYPVADGEGQQWFADPILRDIRRADNRFERLPFATWFDNTDTDVESGEQDAEPELPTTGF